MAYDTVLTVYLVGCADPQRGQCWTPNYDDVIPLRESLVRHRRRLVVLHDCFDEPDSEFVTHVRVATAGNPYFERWRLYGEYLAGHPHVGRVFCVDATDVEMLNDPFPMMVDGWLYVGDEPTHISDAWVAAHHRSPALQSFFENHSGELLLNAGVLGGPRELVMAFAEDVLAVDRDGCETDMGAFNYAAYMKYGDRVTCGRSVTTVFKTYNASSSSSWFRHK